MYSLEKAYTKTLANNQWVETDISLIKLVDLYSKYSGIWCVVSNSFYPANEYHVLKLENISAMASGSKMTLSEFFVNIGNKALPTEVGVLELSTGHVVFQDIYKAGWIPQKTGFSVAPGTNLPESQYDSAFLTHPSNPNYKEVGDYVMANVNGYWHRVLSVTQGLYVKDCIACCRKTGHNAIGFLDFSQVGKVKQIAITESMLSTGTSSESKYRNEVYFNLDEDLTGKTPILVLAGYMVFLEPKLFTISGTKQLHLEMGNYPLLQRYEEALKALSFTGITTLARNQDNASLVGLENFFSDDVVKQLLTMPQSFIVLVDNPALYKERIFLRDLPLPGYYVAYENPKELMFNGFGKVGVYWPYEHTKQWSLNVNEAYRHHFLMDTVEGDMGQVADGSAETVLDDYETVGVVEISQAYLLKIGTSKLKVVPNIAVP